MPAHQDPPLAPELVLRGVLFLAPCFLAGVHVGRRVAVGAAAAGNRGVAAPVTPGRDESRACTIHLAAVRPSRATATATAGAARAAACAVAAVLPRRREAVCRVGVRLVELRSAFRAIHPLRFALLWDVPETSQGVLRRSIYLTHTHHRRMTLFIPYTP